MTTPRPPRVFFFDGDCGLCDRSVRFLMRHDRRAHLRFAPLQGELAAEVLPRNGIDPTRLDTACFLLDVDTPRERAVTRSTAVLKVVTSLGGLWRIAGASLIVPRPIRDAAYDFIAKRRTRIGGKKSQCPLMTPEQRARILP